ncbi:hypothetical protein PRZ48_004267 [Zasmidium cellare]|uniref:DUF7730 domain-containing protein n=1 Tax=Zasmidium cellare TaxID=395010 RepID=A0ABR0EPB9_ZASCE|nr:hypothetical protein PRZ48_004267 [Zasmidium cellare]
MQQKQDSGISLRQMAQWSVDSQTGSRLLILPGEIGTRIYELVLTVSPNDKGKVVIRNDEHRQYDLPTDRSGRPATRLRPSVLAILQTCRLVYQDAAAIFYHNNRLELDRNSLYTEFLDNLSPPRLEAVRVLSVAVPSMSDADFLMEHINNRSGFHCIRKLIIKQDGSEHRGRRILWDLEFKHLALRELLLRRW